MNKKIIFFPDYRKADVRAEWGKKSKKGLKVIDLFAGCGGLSAGIEMAGCEVVAALDFDLKACMTYRKNFTHPIIEGDITKDETKQRLYDAVGSQETDVVCAGFPCQSFSMAGLRLIDDPRNFLYREFVNIVDYFRPKYIVGENVKGFMTKQRGIYPEQLKEDFAKIGYEVDIQVLNAADYGVAQKRERAIIIGNRMGVDNLFPEPIVDEAHYKSVMEAIGELCNASENMKFGHIFTHHKEKTRNQMKGLKEKDHLYESRKSSWTVLPANAPAPTMTENHGAPAIHPIRKDVITPREMARLQSFSDKFDFSAVSKTQMLKQIGNAVPPLLGKAVTLAVCEMEKRRLSQAAVQKS